jgi:hypothetical protein
MLNFETYCFECKKNTILINIHFQRLANYRAIIHGNCSICDSKLIKGKVMPNSSASKKLVKMKRKLLLRARNKK